MGAQPSNECRSDMYFTKPQANRTLHKIYNRIEQQEVVVRLSRTIEPNYAAVCHSQYDSVIILNPLKPLLSPFIHEYLHIFYPDAEDGQFGGSGVGIERMEKELMELLSDRQLENLLMKLVELIRVRQVDLKQYLA